MPDLENYAGREQAYVKHYFLGNYLEALVHKTASSFSHIVYVDGFSGPWQSSGENYGDTSFGIALGALRKAKATWQAMGRDVRMTAHLVEKSARAYKELQQVPARYPDIEVIHYNRDFISAVPEILSSIPNNAFVFLFLDPKGGGFRWQNWKISFADKTLKLSSTSCSNLSIGRRRCLIPSPRTVWMSLLRAAHGERVWGKFEKVHSGKMFLRRESKCSSMRSLKP